MKPIFSSIISGTSLFVLTSCNLYSPLNSNVSDLDKLEEAQKCLKSSDYACAIKQYEKISDSDLKNQKLCQVYLTKGGITLKVLNGTINQNSGAMLSNLALALAPWNSRKSGDLDSAKTYCENFAGSDTSNKMGMFLKTVAEFSHCAIRMAKAKLFRGISDADSNCTYPSTNLSPVLTKEDICTTGDPKGYPGMCYPDVLDCYSDLKAVSYSALASLGYDELSGAVKTLQDQLPNSADATLTRFALHGTFP